ncbi:MAG: hypothetical protein F4073_09955 [Rhodobacteraceae bacterium]|nr:nucleotidyl transferase AbiEii/AbiGii toxin family protein [Gammaproteobacteria bacterium]MYF44967.1 hypothetical protein [Paracoccaceae bacterium]MYG09825.1 hypothetical protein [Paracoccaceae bacterium]MYI92257.1 hypothetical protein [Paracoccaceae bacterium]
MALREQQSAVDYSPQTTEYVKSVLIEIRQILGAFEGKYVIVGGAVPGLLINNQEMPHVGTIDIDIGLHASALLTDSEYSSLIESLLDAGYTNSPPLRPFQLARNFPPSGSMPEMSIIIDFLIPRNIHLYKNKPPLVKNFAAQRADGVDLAIKFNVSVDIDGRMPSGAKNNAKIAVATIPALLAMKGFALNNRSKPKDAYDIYYSVRNFPGGIEVLVKQTKDLLAFESAREGYGYINEKFLSIDHLGPRYVRSFLEDDDRTVNWSPDQLQRDAFGQVDAWLKGIGLRSS